MSQQAKQALLQLVESLLITALITGIISASAAISTSGTLDWQLIGWLFGASFLFSLAHGIAAYFKSIPGSQEQQLGVAIDALIAALEKRFPLAQPTQPTTTATPLQGVASPQEKQVL